MHEEISTTGKASVTTVNVALLWHRQVFRQDLNHAALATAKRAASAPSISGGFSRSLTDRGAVTRVPRLINSRSQALSGSESLALASSVGQS